MRRALSFFVFGTVITGWSLAGFALPQPVAGSGTVNATGETDGVSMTGASGDTLTVGGAFPDINTNNRLVNGVSAVNSALVAIATDTANDDTIVFNTGSTVYGTVGTAGNFFKVINVSAGFTVNFLGTVYTTSTAGSFLIGAGSRANFNSGTGTNIGAIGFSGDGIASLATNSQINGAVITNTDNTGTLMLAGGSKVTGAVTGLKTINVVGGSNIAGVVGTINGATTGIHSVSLLTNELNITGGILTMATNGVINTTLASATVYGHILVAPGYAANLGTGLAVNVTVPSTADFPVGTKFYIVQSTSGTSFLATVTTVLPTNPLYTFDIDPAASAGNATIIVTGIPIQVPLVNPVVDPIAPIAAPIAQALIDAPTTPDITEVRAAINAMTDASSVVNAEVQLAPLAPALAAPLVTFQGVRQFQDLWMARLDMCNGSGKPEDDNDDPACRGSKQNAGWWAKEVGYLGDRKDNGAYKGFDTKILGTMLAYDTPTGLADTRAGVGLGYSRNNIEGKFFDTRTDFNSYRTMAYIGYEPGAFFLNGGLSAGLNEYKNKRQIQFAGVNRGASANYRGQDYTAFTSTGYHVPVQKFSVTPLASLQYTRVNVGSFHENGAGDLDLRVNSQGYDFYESGLGVKISRDFVHSGNTLVPDLHFKWLHDFANPTLNQTARFDYDGTSTFVTHGLKISEDTYNAGLGVTLLSCVCRQSVWSVDAGYDYEWRTDNYSANKGTIRLTKRF